MICRNKFDAPWNEIVAQHVKTIIYVDEGDYEAAFEAQKELVQ